MIIPELTENERVSVWFGAVVAKRYRQLAERTPELAPSLLCGLAASDIWMVITDTENPAQDVAEYLECEELL